MAIPYWVTHNYKADENGLQSLIKILVVILLFVLLAVIFKQFNIEV